MELTQEQERILKAYQQQLSRDREIMATYLMAGGIVLECMDRLSEPHTPLKWIKQDTKAAFKTFESKFTRNNKANLNALFNTKEEDTVEGEILIDTQERMIKMLSVMGRMLGAIPVALYPQVIERVLTMEFMPPQIAEEVEKELE